MFDYQELKENDFFCLKKTLFWSFFQRFPARKLQKFWKMNQKFCKDNCSQLQPGADLGEGAGVIHSLSGIRPAHFRPNNPKIFLKAHLAPLDTNFEGKRASKQLIFWSKFPKNNQKRIFLFLFSKKIASRAKL